MFKTIKNLGLFNSLPEEQRRFVFFSEGAHYYRTFAPVMDDLLESGIPFTYLSMNKTDPGLMIVSDNITTYYIGSGMGFVIFMSMIKARIVIMTTPGLQTLTLKRSSGVKHYVYLFHSPVGLSSYRRFSFDHFDTIMCSGEHQIQEIRQLEDTRSSTKKNLLKTGCAYIDLLEQHVRKMEITKSLGYENYTVIVAPTWGKNGVLGRFGMDLLNPLLNAGFRIIVRPHPQQIYSEKELLDSLKKATKSFHNLRWDENISGHESFSDSDILISDQSGVIFDYAFIYEKPVITIDFPLETKGFEQEDLKGNIWELNMREKLGVVFFGEDLTLIPDLVRKMLSDGNSTQKLRAVREKSLFNFGSVGKIAAKQLIEIEKSL